MATMTLDPTLLPNTLKLVRPLLGLATRRLVADYDAEADVLYLSFARPQKATHSEMRDDGILLNYRDQTLVGITVFEASSR
jgi:uncharacterized protein YuzE